MAAFNFSGRHVHWGVKIYCWYQTAIQRGSWNCRNCKDSDCSGSWTRRLTRNLPKNLLATFLPAQIIRVRLAVTSAIRYNCLLTPRKRGPAVSLQRTRLLLGAIVTVSVSLTRNEELYIGSYEITNTIPFAHPLPPFRTEVSKLD